MARIAIFSYSTSLAHAGRAVTLGRALQSRGHQVTLAGQPRYLESSLLVDRAEFRFELVHEPDLATALAAARGGSSTANEDITFAGALFDEAQLLTSLRPDLVIVDNRRSAVVSAEAEGVPTLSLTNSSLLGPLCAIDPTVQELSTVVAPAIGVDPGQLLSGLGPLADDAAVPTKAIPLPERISSFLRLHFAAPREYVHELNLGTKTMVLDVESIYPVRDLPKGAAAVGPLLFDVATQLPLWWDDLDDSSPIIYATFGSTGEADRFEIVIEELATMDVQVVVTTADLVPAVPDQVRSCRYLPSSAIMKRASLVVCHGGSLTMYQAIRHGTPVLAIPTHIEQAMETIPLLRANAARALAKETIYPGAPELCSRATEMLSDSWFRDNARALAEQVDPDAALAACVEAAEELLARS